MGSQAGIVVSPGRVNLLGEHVDYNDGLVLPAAIDRNVTIYFSLRPDHLVRLEAVDLGGACEFSIDQVNQKLDTQGKQLPDWALYPAGVVWSLIQHGYTVRGFQANYRSNIPIGAGLSSSAAVEVGFAVVCQALSAWNMDRLTLAQICQQAEIEYVGVNCGLMDQFACANGVKDHAVLLDTRNLKFKAVPLPPGTVIVIADSTIRRTLVTSEYNARRRDCETAVVHFKKIYPTVKALRDVSPQVFMAHAHELTPTVYKHARHVVDEIERVDKAIQLLEDGDAINFGKVMFDTHDSLRDYFEVSCKELDLLVEIAKEIPGCFGARLTGAGFGGCTVNLVSEGYAEEFITALKSRYYQTTGLHPNVFLTHASQGAHLLDNQKKEVN